LDVEKTSLSLPKTIPVRLDIIYFEIFYLKHGFPEKTSFSLKISNYSMG
jgi:hypothetical protein